jgi:D-serine deaminase-like pyridoxal phosphate-dependent protein
VKDWFELEDIGQVDSPALIIYQDRVIENIKQAVSMIGDSTRLRPHVKTHKTIEVTRMLMDAGVSKFKCATIAEAEMLGISGARDVLLAYQPAGPKIDRLIKLMWQYPQTTYSCLVDNIFSAGEIAARAVQAQKEIRVFLDLNVGMNRTGITPGSMALDLYKACARLNGIKPRGLHAYDGHLRDADITKRTKDCNEVFENVLNLREEIIKSGFDEPVLIAGGSPTFPIHALHPDRECSPGTFVFWDEGYLNACKEQDFLPAAMVIARVISNPAKSIICIDLGHKSVAAENVLSKRIRFLNAPNLVFLSQSEEHLVASVKGENVFQPDDVLYGLPYHICPTVALYERALIASGRKISGEWKIIARDRKIQI